MNTSAFQRPPIVEWGALLNEIENRIEKLTKELQERPFDSEYPAKQNLTRIERHQCNEQLDLIGHEVKGWAHQIRAVVEEVFSAVMRNVTALKVKSRELQMLEAKRNRENHLHYRSILEERAASEEDPFGVTMNEEGGEA